MNENVFDICFSKSSTSEPCLCGERIVLEGEYVRFRTSLPIIYEFYLKSREHPSNALTWS